MKKFLPFIAIVTLVSCSDSQDPVEANSPEEAKTTPAPSPTTSPPAKSNSPMFDITACKFLTEAQIKQTLGDQITDVSIGEPSILPKSCQKIFTLTLANGDPLRLVFRMEQSTQKGVNKLIKEYTDNAKGIPRLIKMENAPDNRSYIGTHISQRRLYVFRPGETSVVTLTYDVRGEAGGKTPEEVEERRQMGLSLIETMLKD